MRSLVEHHVRWKKRWIVTFWSFQIPFLALDIVILACLLGIEANAFENSTATQRSPAQAWTVVNLVIACPAFLVNCLNVCMYILSDLSPVIYAVCNASSLTLWLIPFAYNLYVISSAWAERGINRIYIYVGAALSSFIFVLLLASFVYSVVVLRALRKRSIAMCEKYAAESPCSQDTYYN